MRPGGAESVSKWKDQTRPEPWSLIAVRQWSGCQHTALHCLYRDASVIHVYIRDGGLHGVRASGFRSRNDSLVSAAPGQPGLVEYPKPMFSSFRTISACQSRSSNPRQVGGQFTTLQVLSCCKSESTNDVGRHRHRGWYVTSFKRFAIHQWPVVLCGSYTDLACALLAGVQVSCFISYQVQDRQRGTTVRVDASEKKLRARNDSTKWYSCLSKGYQKGTKSITLFISNIQQCYVNNFSHTWQEDIDSRQNMPLRFKSARKAEFTGSEQDSIISYLSLIHIWRCRRRG